MFGEKFPVRKLLEQRVITLDSCELWGLLAHNRGALLTVHCSHVNGFKTRFYFFTALTTIWGTVFLPFYNDITVFPGGDLLGLFLRSQVER